VVLFEVVDGIGLPERLVRDPAGEGIEAVAPTGVREKFTVTGDRGRGLGLSIARVFAAARGTAVTGHQERTAAWR
jgi:hypothetical protein